MIYNAGYLQWLPFFKCQFSLKTNSNNNQPHTMLQTLFLMVFICITIVQIYTGQKREMFLFLEILPCILPAATFCHFHPFIVIYQSGHTSIILIKNGDWIQFGWNATGLGGFFGILEMYQSLDNSMFSWGDVICQREEATSFTLKSFIIFWCNDPGIPANLFKVHMEGSSPAVVGSNASLASGGM